MSKKIQITERQAHQFNRMRIALIKIAKAYQTPDQLRRNCGKQYGLGYEETLEMSYENLQAEAKAASKGISKINLLNPLTNGK